MLNIPHPELSGEAETSHSRSINTADSYSVEALPNVSEDVPHYNEKKHRILGPSMSTPAPGIIREPMQDSSSADYAEGKSGRPKLDRLNSWRNALSYGRSVVSSGSERISSKTAKFFGVTSPKIPPERQVSIVDSDLKWKRRRLRYIHRRYSRYGGYKEGEAQKELGNEEPYDNIDVPLELATTPTAVLSSNHFFEPGLEVVSANEIPHSLGRSLSVDSAGKEKLLRRDSVAKMAWDGLSFFVQRGSTRNVLSRQTSKSVVDRERSSSMSFAPIVIQPIKAYSAAHWSSPIPECDISSKTGFSGSPYNLKHRRFPVVDRELGSADSRRSGKATFEALPMTKIEEEPDVSYKKQSTEESAECHSWTGLSEDVKRFDSRGELASETTGVKKPKLSRQNEFIQSQSSRILEEIDTIGPFVQADMEKFGNFVEVSDLEKGREKGYFDSLLQVFPEKINSFTAKNEREPITSSNFDGTFDHPTAFPNNQLFTCDRDERRSDEEDEAFFGVDQISLATVEDLEGVHLESTGLSAAKSAQAESETDTTIPHSFRICKIEEERPEASVSRLLSSVLPLEDESLRTKLTLPRPTSLGLAEFRKQSLDVKKTIADGRPGEEAPLLKAETREKPKFLAQEGSELVSPFSQRIQKIKHIFRVRGPRLPRSRLHGVGFGLWRKFFRRRLNQVDRATADQIESFEDHRPFFTYYVTSVQILVCLASLFFHGFGPVGFDRRERTASVLHTSVVLRQVSIYELEHFWLGPKFSDLVHLGAKYSPCMRRDPQIYEQIEKERLQESETGCCIYNDGVGCFQASRNECPSLIAFLVKWSKSNKGPHGRTSGAVCGQDPNYCEEPLSVAPFTWPDDISKWPLCRRRSHTIPEDQKHLQCEITGRPCCILLHGQCRITTREYCDFVHGFYHPNATLCSQVSCLSEVCGMLPFLHKDQPDQFYRLFLSLFLHAGILHCALTVVIHWYYMRDLEKLIGTTRMTFLYMGSGIGGNLASALLMPYKPEVGPSGSLLGIFSAMYADVIYNWSLIAKPWDALKDLALFTLLLFIVGTLPWIDNWAHIFGFIFGLLISLGTFPYINFGGYDRRRRIVTVIGCWVSIILLFIFFFLKFYKWPKISWKWTEYINCFPFTDHMCDNQGVELKTWLNI